MSRCAGAYGDEANVVSVLVVEREGKSKGGSVMVSQKAAKVGVQ